MWSEFPCLQVNQKVMLRVLQKLQKDSEFQVRFCVKHGVAVDAKIKLNIDTSAVWPVSSAASSARSGRYRRRKRMTPLCCCGVRAGEGGGHRGGGAGGDAHRGV